MLIIMGSHCRTSSDRTDGSLTMIIYDASFDKIKVYNRIESTDPFPPIASRMKGSTIDIVVGQRTVWSSIFQDTSPLYVFLPLHNYSAPRTASEMLKGVINCYEDTPCIVVIQAEGNLNLFEIELWNSTSKISNSKIAASMSSVHHWWVYGDMGHWYCFDGNRGGEPFCQTSGNGGSLTMVIHNASFDKINVYNRGDMKGSTITITIGQRTVWSSVFKGSNLPLYTFSPTGKYFY